MRKHRLKGELGVYAIFTTKTKAEWLAQAKAANEMMYQAGCKNLDEFAEKDPANCGKLLQAMDALGVGVDEKLMKKCGMKRHMTEEEMP